MILSAHLPRLITWSTKVYAIVAVLALVTYSLIFHARPVLQTVILALFLPNAFSAHLVSFLGQIIFAILRARAILLSTLETDYALTAPPDVLLVLL